MSRPKKKLGAEEQKKPPPSAAELRLLLAVVMGDETPPPDRVVDSLAAAALGLGDDDLVKLWISAGEDTGVASGRMPKHPAQWERFYSRVRPRVWRALLPSARPTSRRERPKSTGA